DRGRVDRQADPGPAACRRGVPRQPQRRRGAGAARAAPVAPAAAPRAARAGAAPPPDRPGGPGRLERLAVAGPRAAARAARHPRCARPRPKCATKWVMDLEIHHYGLAGREPLLLMLAASLLTLVATRTY